MRLVIVGTPLITPGFYKWKRYTPKLVGASQATGYSGYNRVFDVASFVERWVLNYLRPTAIIQLVVRT